MVYSFGTQFEFLRRSHPSSSMEFLHFPSVPPLSASLPQNAPTQFAFFSLPPPSQGVHQPIPKQRMPLSRPHVSSRPLCSELVGRALCLSLSLHLSPAANLAASWLCSHAQTERSRTDLSHTHQAALVYFKPQTVWIQDVPGISYGMWQAVWPEQKNQSVVWLPVFLFFVFFCCCGFFLSSLLDCR